MRALPFIMAVIAAAPKAFADTVADPASSPLGANSQVMSFLPLLLIFAIFYFLLIRPQQKRVKEHQLLVSTLKKGDEVVTAGGIVGKITKAAEGSDRVSVEIAKGVEVEVLRSTISTAVNKTAPVGTKSGAVKNDNSAPSRDSVANDN